MGWFNTLLQVAEVGLELGQLAQMQGLNEKQKAMLMNQMGESARQALLQAARDELFEVKQAAERAVELAAERPNVAVAMLTFQRLHLERINLSPELFSDLNDKEYCARTIRFVADHERELGSRLAYAERDEALEMARMALRVADYQYYVDAYPTVQKLRAAKEITESRGYKRYSGVSAPLRFGTGGKAMVGFVFVSMALIIPLIFSDFLFTLLAWAILGAPVYIYLQETRKYREFQQARSEVALLSSQVDLDRFAQLEAEFGQEYEAVTKRLRDIESRLARFFNSPSEAGRALLASLGTEAVAQRHCPSCQVHVPETAGFCHKCGARLDDQKEAET